MCVYVRVSMYLGIDLLIACRHFLGGGGGCLYVCISLAADGPQRARLPIPPTAKLPILPVVT